MRIRLQSEMDCTVVQLFRFYLHVLHHPNPKDISISCCNCIITKLELKKNSKSHCITTEKLHYTFITKIDNTFGFHRKKLTIQLHYLKQ